MRRSILLTIFLSLATSASSFAQQPAKSPPEPPLRRWLEIQQFNFNTRFRYTENSRDVVTTNQQQYKDAVRAKFNIDPQKRYTINVGYFTGSSFISSWNNTGWGNNTTFDHKNNYFKQLYGSAVPVKGLDLQYGGLYINRGESDEWSYDDDGYMAGGRVSIRRPKELYLDEITVTRGGFGPLTNPNLFDRGFTFTHPNYTQLLGLKR